MKIIPAKTPEFVKSLFPNFVWTIPTNGKDIYLTFDDGPTPEITQWVLQTLKDYKAKATFFCIGNNIKSFPEILHEIIEGEHTIGNHTFNHLKGWQIKTKEYINDVELTNHLISGAFNSFTVGTNQMLKTTSHITSKEKKLFRPPYGKFKSKQSKALQNLGYSIILWDVLSFDWDKNTTEVECLENVILKVKPGSIVVFHDSLKAERNLKYALPKVLDHFSREGYNFKAIN
ncbi:polysaccharide deacetylase family protein [Winogradskyella sp. DF17]|uniref:Polysaccharide deacetylase family protein n=1 Tax=Winogradskyella pelagia TaxID=2819984 RepID=A0ABS3SYG4_9FLAO|nr:polysaccharide deacetylase family protein [Winogradskyella sp. DF17]MBO3115532.1 polysaccharide deacetylase family protein [Winogradskyella sp. DF17]